MFSQNKRFTQVEGKLGETDEKLKILTATGVVNALAPWISSVAGSGIIPVSNASIPLSRNVHVLPSPMGIKSMKGSYH